MSKGRNGIDHAECDALPDEPIGGSWRRQPAAALERIVDQRQALIETVAAIFDIVPFVRAGRDHRIARLHHVARAKFNRIHAEPPRQLVHRQFNGKIGLRQSVTAEAAGR